MSYTGFTLILLTALLAGCSNTAEKERALKALELNQQKLSVFKKNIADLKNALPDWKGQLEAAKDRVNQVKGFQLLRTPEEREQQIKDATADFLRLEENVSKAEQLIEAYADSVFITTAHIDDAKRILRD